MKKLLDKISICLCLFTICAFSVVGMTGNNASGDTAADIVLTLDVSGSISEAEITQEVNGLKECLEEFPTDGSVGVGIVVYGVGAAICEVVTPLTPESLQTICETLLSLISPGAEDGVDNDPARKVGTTQTDIAAGINEARGLLNATPTEQDFILLVGDGGSNIGGVPQPAATQAACEEAAEDEIIICALAVASDDAGEDELEACALATGGLFAIGTFENFAEICEDCLNSFLIGTCLNPIVTTDPGLCTAEVPCEDIASFTNLFGDNIVLDSLECDPAGPYDNGETNVDVTATVEGFSPSSLTIECPVTVNDEEPPVISCTDPTVECDGAGNLEALNEWLNEGASAEDNCPGTTVISQEASFEGGCGNTGVWTATFVATDAAGNQSTCQGTFTIVDTVPPVINSNNPDTIFPSDAPITFCATAEDICCRDDVSVEITGVRCSAVVGRTRKLIDKSESCVYTVDGPCITIIDGGGVGTRIDWDILSVDCCGNESTATVGVEVINFGQSK